MTLLLKKKSSNLKIYLQESKETVGLPGGPASKESVWSVGDLG